MALSGITDLATTKLKAGWQAFNQLITDLASTANGKGASCVGVEDSAGNFTGTDIEAVLVELADTDATFSDLSNTFEENSATTTGLTWGYKGGRIYFNGTLTTVAAGTVSLTDDATNYIEYDPLDTTVKRNTTAFTTGKFPLRQVVAASGSQSSSSDKRSFINIQNFDVISTDGTTVLDSGTDGTDATVILKNDTGLGIYDSNNSHLLYLKPGSDLTANRTATLATGDADRTITINGNPTLNDWFDQSLKQAASPTFVTITPSSGTITTDIVGNASGSSATCTGAFGTGATAPAGGSSASAGGTRSTALGNSANASGQEAIAIGDAALADATAAIAIGDAADAGGVGAIAIGDAASASYAGTIAIGDGAKVSGAAASIAIGSNSGGNNNTLRFSVCVGDDSSSNMDGAGYRDNITAIGYQAHYNSGTSISGENNTCVGYQTGTTITSGSNVTILGANAEPSSGSASNEVTIGDTSVATSRVQVDWTVLSDERDKTDITPIADGLNFISNLNPVNFRLDLRKDYFEENNPRPILDDYFDAVGWGEEQQRYTTWLALNPRPQIVNYATELEYEAALSEWELLKEAEDFKAEATFYDRPAFNADQQTWKAARKAFFLNPTKDGTKKREDFQAGFLAQNVVSALTASGNQMGRLKHIDSDETDQYEMSNTELIPFLVKAIQEQQALITDLQDRVTALESA